MKAVLLDIGGTKTRVSVSRDGKTFADPMIFATPKDFREGVEKIKGAVHEMLGGEQPDIAAGGIAGILSRDRATFIEGPNLPGWSGRNIPALIGNALGCACFLENDTAMVGLGEYVAGAGKEFHEAPEIFSYITVSTGVGGVRIVDGRIDKAAFTFEPGHQIVDAGGALHKGLAGFGSDLEGYISGHAIEERYGKKPYEITDEKIWDELAKILAYGLNNTILHWSPDVVAIGGSMMKQIGIPLDRVQHYLAGMLHVYPQLPRIVPARLGDVGGLHGALELAKQKTK